MVHTRTTATHEGGAVSVALMIVDAGGRQGDRLVRKLRLVVSSYSWYLALADVDLEPFNHLNELPLPFCRARSQRQSWHEHLRLTCVYATSDEHSTM